MYRTFVSNVLKSISILLLLLLPLSSSQLELNESFVYTPKQLEAFKIFDDEQSESTQIMARSFICVPLFRIFNLELKYNMKLSPDESIAVSGDHTALGHWRLEKALPMKEQNAARTKWYLRVWICATQRFYYRYVIFTKNSEGERVLRRWEGQQVARMLQTYEIYRSPGLDVFGEAYPRSEGGGLRVEQGWLESEYVIELKFIWDQHITINGLTSNAKFRLLLTPLNVLDNARIEISRYIYNKSTFHLQSQLGVRYSPGNIVIYRIYQSLSTRNSFRLSIYQAKEPKHSLGEVFIFPDQIKGSRGILQLPILSAFESPLGIGQLMLPYLVVQPMPQIELSNLRASFQQYWPNNWPTMDIGHRGLGASYYQTNTKFTENTIESFLSVTEHKGDMVQLDVQLTKDYVPIVWHGFGFYTARKDHLIQDRFDLHYVLIRDLTYKELKASRVFILRRWSVQEYTHLNVKDVNQVQRIFPKLSEVYESVPKSLGLLVEIKWPQLMASGVLESTQAHNKNVYVDRIIQTTIRFGCGRPIIFSSFDVDICTMVRLKQHTFPVLLMSIGRSNIWDPYMDLRTQSFLQAVNFADSAEILGTALHVENFLVKQELVNLGLDQQQVVFLWGNDLADEQMLEQFRAMDVNGLIYDHMDRVGPSQWKRAPFFKAHQLVEIFGGQCVAIGNSSSIPGVKPAKPTIWPKLR
ncbi:uncharacterized protein Dwil_GK12589 [Drosophila willistoni]|uniref:Uncharacterized protein n=1 Tax=Drosophila willistoni TaxID=7260 RepID=B4N4S0_DROWI|nr:glycerophosphocholine phosphodiesterase GPCPD1 [Drosophila willistoni]EDW79144.1 uncharacterized protein Dwil_GK12589 [Drosophila willistoni]